MKRLSLIFTLLFSVCIFTGSCSKGGKVLQAAKGAKAAKAAKPVKPRNTPRIHHVGTTCSSCNGSGSISVYNPSVGYATPSRCSKCNGTGKVVRN